MSITIEERDKAMEYLADTDVELARLKGAWMDEQRITKRIFAACYLAETGSVEDKKQKATKNPLVVEQETKEIRAMVEHDEVKNKRDTEQLRITVWQSEGANRRAGIIL